MGDYRVVLLTDLPKIGFKSFWVVTQFNPKKILNGYNMKVIGNLVPVKIYVSTKTFCIARRSVKTAYLVLSKISKINQNRLIL